MVGDKRLARFVKAAFWILLKQCFLMLLWDISNEQLIAAADIATRSGTDGFPDGVIVQKNIAVVDGNMNEPVQVNIKENIIKLKNPDSYVSDDRECILGQASYYLKSWLMANATINHTNTALHDKYMDLSYSSSNIKRHIFKTLLQNNAIEFVYVSLAHRNMFAVPFEELFMMNTTLQYLSMAGNNFQYLKFPALYNLKVLDLRNCGLRQLEFDTFSTFDNLEQLYLSHNYLMQLTATHIQPLAMLRHLDLAYNSNGQEVYYNTYLSLETEPDPYTSLTEGLDLTEDVFDPLERLVFLDLSHTKLLPTSARAFRKLAVEQLSLCYTEISIIVGTMMYGTLRALDISGNPGITAAIHRDPANVRGLNGNIEVLACENASVKYLDWIDGMVNLRVLMLSYNNINQLTNDTFATLGRLEVLDLSANHISNWRWRVFTANPNLTVLDLSANNLNVLTTEMLHDFEHVRFLAIGQNSFMCHCLLRELIDMAVQNPDGLGCIIRSMGQYYLRRDDESEGVQLYGLGDLDVLTEPYGTVEHFVAKAIALRSMRLNSTIKIRTRSGLNNRDQWHSHYRSLQILPCNANASQEEGSGESSEEGQLIQLIDFDTDSYKCRDLENVEYSFDEQEKCTFDRAVLDELLFDNFNNTTATVIKFLIIFFGFALVAFIIYVSKWDYVKYFCIILRNATVLSIMRHKSEDLEETRKRRVSTHDFAYDVFVSYSEHDRQWILDELLPNLERSEDISVCLHERDFKVGVSILENIIHCMDHSRTLLLVVSECFLLSHWCQFEMHLAQHRLLETRREHLILVMLEDIPKIKRPRTLQYLMKTKTYIKWPTASADNALDTDDRPRTKRFWNLGRNKQTSTPQHERSASSTLLAERNLFWDRLKKAIHDGINWEPNDDALVSNV